MEMINEKCTPTTFQGYIVRENWQVRLSEFHSAKENLYWKRAVQLSKITILIPEAPNPSTSQSC